MDFTGARDKVAVAQLDHIRVLTDNHASTPPLRLPFLPPNSVKALKAQFN